MKISKKYLCLFFSLILVGILAVIFVNFPLIKDSLGVEQTLYESLDTFFETDLNFITDRLEDLDPKYVLDVSGYLVLAGSIITVLLYLINTLLPFRLILLKIFNFIVSLVVVAVVGFGIYSLVKFNVDYMDVVTLRLYSYLYFGAGLLVPVFVSVGLFNKRRKKEK